MSCARLAVFVVISLVLASPLAAQTPTPTLELSFTPTDRAQVAVWVEREDGAFMGTLALTYAVAKAGIGNRPGALQMNSGFRWPYGRREGVLPVWAHRRAAAPGAQPWKRVIFQDRTSEGHASRSSNDMSPDNYYCLSFGVQSSAANALDAVTCASVFSSDKGRFIKEADVARGYAEPWEDAPGVGRMRTLDLVSLYPPRRDVERCLQSECYDHADLSSYRAHALEVMPELDAVTRATLQGRRPAQWSFSVPPSFPREERYKLFVEVNVEGDHYGDFSDTAYPTPRTPAGTWDALWAVSYGYAYRGQPSVVFEVPFSLQDPEPVSSAEPSGYGALHGEDGALTPMSSVIRDEPAGKPGSGADRLLLTDGARLSVRVLIPDTAYCLQTSAPGAVGELRVRPVRDKRQAHMWASLSFKAPESTRPIGSYVVEVKADGADWEQAYAPDSEQALLPVALDMCADPERPGENRCDGMQPGTELEATLAALNPLTHYAVRVSARDRSCGELGETALAEVTMPGRTFATVTPCFIATAAYGSPLAQEISVLRAVRDRYFATDAFGRALIDTYYAVGPTLARPVAEHSWLAATVRAVLWPIVKLAAWWSGLGDEAYSGSSKK